jgi:hypothetical protein
MEPRGVTGPRPARGGVRVISACGAPSVWSAGGRATVLSCIGCGRIDTAQQCAGTCGEHRLEIVPAAAHDGVVAALAAEREREERLRAFAERLSAGVASEAAYRSLRAGARELIATAPPAEEPAERLLTWACGGCGRVEAEAPCVGVCTDAPLDVVRADVHDRARAALEACRGRVRSLTAPVRLAAFTTPRPAADWQAHVRALQRVADERLARL